MTPTSTKWLSSTARMARISAHHAWRTISTWVLLLVFVGVASTGRGGASTNEGNFTGKPEAVRADDLLSEHTRGGEGDPLTETILVSSEPLTVDDAAFRAVVDQAAVDLSAIGD